MEALTESRNPQTEIITPDSDLARRLVEVAGHMRRLRNREFLESILGERLTRFFHEKLYEGRENEGWPLPGGWDFALIEDFWSMLCESGRFANVMNGGTGRRLFPPRHIQVTHDGEFRLARQFHAYDRGLQPLNEIIQGDAMKLRRLFLEAMMLHWLMDYMAAPGDRKGYVGREVTNGLPRTLSNFGIILEAFPGIEVIEATESTIYEAGKTYRLQTNRRRPPQITVYCLGTVNDEAFFEMDKHTLHGSTPYSLGDQTQISIPHLGNTKKRVDLTFVGLTLSGKPVFVDEEGRLHINPNTQPSSPSPELLSQALSPPRTHHHPADNSSHPKSL